MVGLETATVRPGPLRAAPGPLRDVFWVVFPRPLKRYGLHVDS
jgi:hypothetical protein